MKQTPPLEYSVSTEFLDNLVVQVVWPPQTANQNAYLFKK